MQLHASLSVSIGRQPYTDEDQGSLLVRLSEEAFPTADVLMPAATLLVSGSHHKLALSGPKLQRGRTVVLSFPLADLPPTILVAAGAMVRFELVGGRDGNTAAFCATWSGPDIAVCAGLRHWSCAHWARAGATAAKRVRLPLLLRIGGSIRRAARV